MIEVTDTITIPDDEIEMSYIRSSGPGGQNVNKVATAAQLRFNVRANTSLSHEARERLSKIAGQRMTRDGVLIITARRYRSQEQNRNDAIERLIALVRRALVSPKKRRKTRPTKAAKAKRLDDKRRRSRVKRLRRLRQSDADD